MEDVMPRFFLHVRDGEKLFKDGEGQEFPSLAEARTEAVLSARELMAALIRQVIRSVSWAGQWVVNCPCAPL
jgi:hypothetical protein